MRVAGRIGEGDDEVFSIHDLGERLAKLADSYLVTGIQRVEKLRGVRASSSSRLRSSGHS